MTEKAVLTTMFDVCVVSENRLLRDVLTKLLRKKAGVRSVSALPFSGYTVNQVAKGQAHILLLDPAGATRPILQVVAEAKDAVPELQVILIGMQADPETFVRCVGAGIAGYVLKDASGNELAQALISVAHGLAVCPPDLCLGLFQYVARESKRLAERSPCRRLGLTSREQQLAIQAGFTNKEIATKFHLSEQTVKNHIHRILRKVGASDRHTAAEICRVQGFLAG
ncbi:MAG TPA: response regulator transcription factor [Terriglobales bacterium]|nr:response regulator transcription factor [Terriglobales bacterium]